MQSSSLHIQVRWSLIALGILFALTLVLPWPISQAAEVTTRYFAPPAWSLGPMIGSAMGEAEWNTILDQIDANHLPITTVHFDGHFWETCNNNANFAFSDAFIQRLRDHNLRAIFWIVPLIDLHCPEYAFAASHHYFVSSGSNPIVTHSSQGTGSWIDFNKPAAVAYWHSLLDRVTTRLTGIIGGFYIDDMRPDLHGDTTYADAYAHDLLNYTRAHIPDGDVVMKRFGMNTPSVTFLSKYAHITYVNDAPSDFTGLRAKAHKVLSTGAHVPAAFSEFPGYLGPTPDVETYTRRLHWGAFQVVMEDDTTKSFFPWSAFALASTVPAYQYYTTLHWELVPYLHSYDEAAYETNTPILRNSNTKTFSTELGNEIFVQYITSYTNSATVTLPAGQWINYWNEQQVITGSRTIQIAAPINQEPTFIRNGAIIPMQVRDSTTGHGTSASAGSLTVNVFPNGASSFRYFDATNHWVNFSAQQNGNTLTLCTQPAPSQTLIYRIARWATLPTSITTSGGAIGVNTAWGTALAQLSSESAVDASQDGWYYDAATQHLFVKLMELGTGCPAS